MKYLLLLIIISLSISCRKDKAQEVKPVDKECAVERSFSEDVLPIINTNCSTSGCHNANTQAGGYILESHQQIDQHALIMLSTMKHETSSPMPKGEPKLADSLIETFDCWIKQGKSNN